MTYKEETCLGPFNMMNSNDYDGFCDRQFFVCPPDRDVDFEELTPVPADVPSFGDIFRVIRDASQDQNNDINRYECDTDGK